MLRWLLNRLLKRPDPLQEYDAFWRDATDATFEDIETRARKQRQTIIGYKSLPGGFPD